MKTVGAEIGSNEDRVDTYKVRKTVVGNALCWLKEFNVEHKDVEIDMSVSDWLCGEDGSLETVDFGFDGATEFSTYLCGTKIIDYILVDRNLFRLLAMNHSVSTF